MELGGYEHSIVTAEAGREGTDVGGRSDSAAGRRGQAGDPVNAKQARTATESAALMLIMIVGLFVFGSMVALIVLAFTGATGGESVWAGLFSLMTAALGCVVGVLGGSQYEQRRRTAAAAQPPPPPTEPSV